MSVIPFIEVVQTIADMGGSSIYQCMQCGLCSALCPWSIVKSPFYTRQLIRMGQLGLDGLESDELLYACTTCKLCVDNCPRGVKIVDIIRAMRTMIAETGAVPQIFRTVIGSIHSNGNPWSENREKRLDLAKNYDIPLFEKNTEYFLSICCTSAFDSRSRKIAQALSKILKSANISFGVIGNEESCCGESLRKIGGEDDFIKLANKNISLFIDKGVKKIITVSPHCYITFSQEYSKLGGIFQVVHYTQILAELLKEKRLTLSNDFDNTKVIYHDPCYLVRYGGIFEQPREIIKAVPGLDLIEFDRNCNLAVCCGGGGGRMWIETELQQRFSSYKVNEVKLKGASILATACPYCLTMFVDTIKSKDLDEKIIVMDLSEIIASSI